MENKTFVLSLMRDDGSWDVVAVSPQRHRLWHKRGSLIRVAAEIGVTLSSTEDFKIEEVELL